MGIQAWFILIGVSAMTLIVWDGRRRKARQRAEGSYSSGDVPQPSPAVSLVSDIAVEQSPPKATVTPLVAPLKEGSRIGAATSITGDITANEPVLVKGNVQGRVVASQHSLTVNASGQVAPYIEGGFVTVDGHVSGTLKAHARATLLPQATVQGVIDTPCLECEAGAWLQARVRHHAVQQNVTAMVS